MLHTHRGSQRVCMAYPCGSMSPLPFRFFVVGSLFRKWRNWNGVYCGKYHTMLYVVQFCSLRQCNRQAACNQIRLSGPVGITWRRSTKALRHDDGTSVMSCRHSWEQLTFSEILFAEDSMNLAKQGVSARTPHLTEHLPTLPWIWGDLQTGPTVRKFIGNPICYLKSSLRWYLPFWSLMRHASVFVNRYTYV